jgi:hypothetical protein
MKIEMVMHEDAGSAAMALCLALDFSVRQA